MKQIHLFWLLGFLFPVFLLSACRSGSGTNETVSATTNNETSINDEENTVAEEIVEVPPPERNGVIRLGTNNGYGIDEALDAMATEDGYLITGKTARVDSDVSGNEVRWYEAWIVKLNKDLDIAWELRMDVSTSVGIKAIVVGDTYLVVSENTNEDVWVAQISSSGDIFWETVFGTPEKDVVYDVVATDDGYAVLGSITGRSFGHFVTKLDLQGSMNWSKIYTPFEFRPSQIMYRDGELYVVGESRWSGEPSDAYIQSIRSGDGSIVWLKTVGTPASENVSAFDLTEDNGFVLVGWSEANTANGGGWIVKLNSELEVEWQQTVGTGGVGRPTRLLDVKQAGDGYVAVGDKNGVGQPWLVKFGLNGSIQWEKTLSSEIGAWRLLYRVDVTSEGGILVAGQSAVQDDENGLDGLVIKTDGSGNIQACDAFLDTQSQVMDTDAVLKDFSAQESESELVILDNIAPIENLGTLDKFELNIFCTDG